MSYKKDTQSEHRGECWEKEIISNIILYSQELRHVASSFEYIVWSFIVLPAIFQLILVTVLLFGLCGWFFFWSIIKSLQILPLICLSVGDLRCLYGGASENGEVKRERKTKSSDRKERGEEEGKKVNFTGITGIFHSSRSSLLRVVVNTSIMQAKGNGATRADCAASSVSWHVTNLRNATTLFFTRNHISKTGISSIFYLLFFL